MAARELLVLVGVAALGGAAVWARVQHVHADRRWAAERARAIPGAHHQDRYAGSDSCRACHGAAWSSWHHSFHRTMTQPAGRDTIVAPWHGELPGGVALRWADRRPEIVRTGADGRTRTEAVVMTTGSHHMQLYWRHDDERGTLQAFEYAWLIDAQRWVPNEATLLRPPSEPPVYTWNRVCVRCHATAGSPGWRALTGEVDTRVVELGIACESCHGPARAHVEHHRAPWRRWFDRDGTAPDDIVQPAELAPAAASQVCAQCHAITVDLDEDDWLVHGPRHAAGDPLAQWGLLVRHPARDDAAWLDELLAADPDHLVDRFWSDGMVRVTGREYNAVVESPCHQGGELSCLSCHALHDGTRADQLRAGHDGDAACVQCHDAGRYADAAHTHHAPAGEGARCMNCHMPRTAWGLLGAIRSHQVDSPDVAVAEATGRPTACNLCHLDRPLAWTDAWLRRWRGDDAGVPEGGVAEAARGLLAAEAGVRALWAWHLAWPPAVAISGARWQPALLLEALADPYPAVREVAWRSLQQLVPGLPALAPGTVAGPDELPPIRAILAERGADRAGAAVLRRPDGALDDVAIRALQAARDDRRVALAE